MQKAFTDATAPSVTLANEKETLSGKILTLENEKTTLANEKKTLGEKVTVLENEKTELVEKVSGERKSRAGAVVDLAITRGKLTVAEREAKITALANEADFDAASKLLLGAATKTKVIATIEDGKVVANAGTDGNPDARQQYCSAIQDHMKASGETDPIKAHKAVMAKYPALADALKAKGESAK